MHCPLSGTIQTGRENIIIMLFTPHLYKARDTVMQHLKRKADFFAPVGFLDPCRELLLLSKIQLKSKCCAFIMNIHIACSFSIFSLGRATTQCLLRDYSSNQSWFKITSLYIHCLNVQTIEQNYSLSSTGLRGAKTQRSKPAHSDSI